MRDDLLPHEAGVADRVDSPPRPSSTALTDGKAARHVGDEEDGVVLDEGQSGRISSYYVSISLGRDYRVRSLRGCEISHPAGKESRNLGKAFSA